MKKRIVSTLPVLILSVILCSCTLFVGTIDKKTGFSDHLKEMETQTREQNWSEAISAREEAFEVWCRIKPILQIDVDHDYVNLLEDSFVMLQAYLETQDKSQALAMILLIRDTWENIGVL